MGSCYRGYIYIYTYTYKKRWLWGLRRPHSHLLSIHIYEYCKLRYKGNDGD